MRLYELTKPEAYKKYGSREKVRSAPQTGDKLSKAQRMIAAKAKHWLGMDKKDKQIRAQQMLADTGIDPAQLDSMSNREEIDIVGNKIGPTRLLDLVDVELKDPDSGKDYPRNKGQYTQLPSTKQGNKLVSTNFGDRTWNEILKHGEGRNILHIEPKQLLKRLHKLTGLYMWMHDHFGIFYIGIASPNVFLKRVDTHTQKLTGRLMKSGSNGAYAPVNWVNFSEAFLKQGTSGRALKVPNEEIQADLDKVRVVWYPIDEVQKPNNISDSDWYEVWKYALERIETRLVTKMNPRANKASDDSKPSVTRNYDPYKDYRG
jgi:hypothetical protein